MENKKETAQEELALTSKDLHCIARHIQIDVVERKFKENKDVEDACTYCQYAQTCLTTNKSFDPWIAFYKLSDITGVKITALHGAKVKQQYK